MVCDKYYSVNTTEMVVVLLTSVCGQYMELFFLHVFVLWLVKHTDVRRRALWSWTATRLAQGSQGFSLLSVLLLFSLK